MPGESIENPISVTVEQCIRGENFLEIGCIHFERKTPEGSKYATHEVIFMSYSVMTAQLRDQEHGKHNAVF